MSVDWSLWHVRTVDGDIHRMSLDQIDEAFNAGRIDVNTMCLPGGATRWERLGALAGLDGPAPAPVPPRAPAPAAYAPTAYAPTAYAAPAYAAPAYAAPAYAAPVYAAPAYAARAYAATAYAPTANAPVANSLRPVATEVSDDLDEPFARKSGKGRVVGVLTLVAILGAGAILAVRSGAVRARAGVSTTRAAAAAVAMPSPPAQAQASPPAAAAPTPPPPTAPANLYAPPIAAVPANDPSAAHLTNAQKAKLLAADKAREDGAKARKKARQGHHPSRKYKSQGFTTGGDKYDPLNATF